MFVIYVDESGTPETEARSKHFVIAGVAIPLSSWKRCDAELRGLLARHRLGGAEIRAAWMARLYPEQERIPAFEALSDDQRRSLVNVERKKDLGKAALSGEAGVRSLRRNYEKTNAYLHLSRSERMETLRALADAVGSWPDVRLFADAQLKSVFTPEWREKAREHGLEQVTTRFNAYLGNVHGPGALSLLVHDQHQAASTRLTALFRGWHESGTRYTSIPHIAETPLFVDSALTVMVQVADLVAYATRRFFDKAEADLFDRFYSRFDRRPAGTLVGLRHFTAKTACSCRVCLDHGR